MKSLDQQGCGDKQRECTSSGPAPAPEAMLSMIDYIMPEACSLSVRLAVLLQLARTELVAHTQCGNGVVVEFDRPRT